MTKYSPFYDEELIASAKLQAIPIDYEKLELEGILKKQGAWYLVDSLITLPDYVNAQVSEFKNNKGGGVLIKLPKSWDKAQRIYKKLTGKDFIE